MPQGASATDFDAVVVALWSTSGISGVGVPALSGLGRVFGSGQSKPWTRSSGPRMRERVDQLIRKLIYVLLAVFAFCALMVSAASAEITLLAEWLLNGNPILILTSTEVKGALTLRDSKTIAGSAAVLCKATADGSVGPNGEDETTEILNALGVAVAALGGLALLGTGAATGEGSECVTVETCAAGTAASPIEVNPIGLPWLTLLFLDQGTGEFLNLIYTEIETTIGAEKGLFVGYELLCLVLNLNTEDTCYAEKFEIPVINDPENAAIAAGVETTPLALCTQSNKEESGHNISDELALIEELEPLVNLLTASSEP